jgi:signal transduction histidine kinase
VVGLLLYYLYACILSIIKSRREQIYFLAGLILFVAAMVNDIMVANSISTLSKNYTVHYALQVFVFIQAVLVIRNWISAFREREKLLDEIANINKNLETLVDERTLELNKRNREIQRKGEDIERRNKELKEALNFKNRIFSIIAHDLKSPVASLVQNSVLLDYNLTQEENRKLINSFRELSRSALNLIDNLLYWGRSQGAQLHYDPQIIDVREVVEGAFSLLGEMAGQKSVSLEYHANGNISVYADRELLDIICRNILSNAIKFTGKGGHVSIYSDTTANTDRIILRIRDNGKGIPEERLKEILYGRELISTAGTERERGTGLGLKLCQELVIVNKGELRIESRVGQGTTVSVSLPAAPSGV